MNEREEVQERKQKRKEKCVESGRQTHVTRNAVWISAFHAKLSEPGIGRWYFTVRPPPHRLTNRLTDRLTDHLTDHLTDRQTGRLTDRKRDYWMNHRGKKLHLSLFSKKKN